MGMTTPSTPAPLIYLVADASVIALYERQTFHRTPTSDGMNLGAALYEPEGVPGRRGAFCYRWDGAQVVYAVQVAKSRGHTFDPFTDALPSDWRFCVPPGA